MPRIPDVVGVLAQHGLAPGPNGFALEDLEAVIAAHGWRVEIDERPPVRDGYQTTPHVEALIFASVPLDQAARPRSRMARGRGDTRAAALAQALAKLLA
jgi:hypothetical protein